ncbi:HTH domain-containing protein [Solibacillus sp. CAU 1738]
MEKIKQLQLDNVSYTFYFYNSSIELEALFLEHANKFDGIAFSGQIPYLHIQSKLPNEANFVPRTFFDISQRDFYYTLAEIQYKDPSFSLKESIIDFIYNENNYLDLKQWLPQEDFPYILSDTIEIFGHPDTYDIVSNRHLSLWREKKVRYSFTRLTNLHQHLKEDHIEPILVVPTEYSMVITLTKLIKEIELVQLTNSQVVTGRLIFSTAQNDAHEIEYRQIALYKAILDFNRELGIPLITFKSAIHYEIITNYIDLLTITNNLKSCSLTDFLEKELPFKVKIGWGIGKTLDESRLQAEKAATFCQGGFTQSYVLTKENQVIGPLDGQSQMTPAMNDKELNEVAEQTNLALFQLQKISAVLEKLKTDEVMAEDLAAHLSISIRTANRILKRLQETGYATVLEKKLLHVKGRPPKVYKISLHKTVE